MSNAGLQSQQWGRKIGAARAVKALCKLGGKGSMSQHAISIARQLLQVHAHALSSFQIRQHSPSVNCMPGISPSIFQGHSDPMSPELRRAENFPVVEGTMIYYPHLIMKWFAGNTWEAVGWQGGGARSSGRPHCDRAALHTA